MYVYTSTKYKCLIILILLKSLRGCFFSSGLSTQYSHINEEQACPKKIAKIRVCIRAEVSFRHGQGSKQANCTHVLDANYFVNAKPHVRGKKPQLAGFYTCIAEPRVV